MKPLLRSLEFDILCSNEAACPNSAVELGSVQQRTRIAALAERCCSHVEGDLIELGSYAGATSAILAQLARKYGRTLVCVDNWLPGDFHLDEVGQKFVESMRQYADVLLTIHDDAHAPQVIEMIQKRRYCFAFCDADVTVEGVSSELMTLLPLVDGMICVDDVNVPEVVEAVSAVMGTGDGTLPGWDRLEDKRLREMWLVKNS